jgi:serine protease AprX
MKKQAWAVLALSAALTVTSVGSVTAAKDTTPAPVKESTKMVDADNNKMFDDLETMLTGKGSNDKVAVIVRMNEKFTNAKLNSIKGQVGDFTTKFTYEYAYQGFAAEMTKGQIMGLQHNPMIESIQYDAPVQMNMATAKDSFGSNKAITDFGVTGDRDGSATTYSKTDVVVAVIDTGINAAHTDLDGGKVIAFKDFVNARTTAYDDQGHGTHCAGIVAGTGESNSGYKGVAPGAALVGIKVLDSQGSGSMSNVDAGINWAIQNKDVYGIKVLSLSLGTSGSSNGQDSTSVAVNNAYAAGLISAVAAGNSGPARSTIGSPGAAANALTVGAFADVGEKGFNVTSFSSRGPTADGRIKPDVMAPGFNIMSTSHSNNTGYLSMSGTSMATPFAAGVAALMLDANYALTAADIKSKMTSTAQDWGNPGQDIDYGYGRLQAYEAIKSAGGLTGTGPVVPLKGGANTSLTTSGSTLNYTYNVTSTTTPFAATLIMTNHPGQDFDLFVYNPSGTLVAKSEGVTRQELVTFNPTVTGAYKVTVKSYSGTGAFNLDVSYR